MGDSLSAAYGIATGAGWVNLLARRLKRKGYDYRVANASISGDTTRGGLARLPAALDRYDPAIVILELGANNGLRGQSLKAMRADLARMIKLARAAGACVLLVGVRMPPNFGRAYAHRFHQVYLDLAKKKHVALVPEILAGIAAHPKLMQPDGHHPVATAEPRVLDNIWARLKHMVAERRGQCYR